MTSILFHFDTTISVFSDGEQFQYDFGYEVFQALKAYFGGLWTSGKAYASFFQGGVGFEIKEAV